MACHGYVLDYRFLLAKNKRRLWDIGTRSEPKAKLLLMEAYKKLVSSEVMKLSNV
jgi:hypothetical protein